MTLPTLPPGVTARLSEKTIELNLARQLAPRYPGAFWFGLTQRQEAANGYDAAISIGGRMFLFQYKVSTKKLRGGTRQFRLPHDQLTTLQTCVKSRRRVFYAFPDVGTVPEAAASGWNLARSTWFVDVADIPDPLPEPTTQRGSPRLSRIHYADLYSASAPAHIVIRSEPHEVNVVAPDLLFGEQVPEVLFRTTPDVPDPILERFWEIRAALGRRAIGVVIPVDQDFRP